MRLLHTSDWHLGHTLRNFDRSYEHQCFLDWLLEQLVRQDVDVLLIAGDIFDTVNPSAQAQAQYYRFLAAARSARPGLQTIVIAGNHDSAGRLEAPRPLLQALEVRVVGQVPRLADGSIDLDALLLPLGDASAPAACCLAVPYLRPADLPPLPQAADPYSEGVRSLYRQLQQRARERHGAALPLIAMGHCHVRGGSTSDDSERRLVIGGNEALPADAFAEDLAYVALGHLHLAQQVGGRDTLRYCGAPLPFSFNEARYPHQVLLVDLPPQGPARIESLRVPRFVELLRVPEQAQAPAEVLQCLQALQLPARPLAEQPLLEVPVLPEGTLAPEFRQQVEQALAGKPVRFLRLDPQRRRGPLEDDSAVPQGLSDLSLDPLQVLRAHHQRMHGQALPAVLEELLLELLRADGAADTASRA